ncbi:ATP-dependent helicase (plasmid) [Fulvitalea axinellae]|uniref:ATP-dependent helicase n=1 Tax=Fulvitalea axinellae TaxID=1182444 RepID=A0AAU9DAW0_9BACT|nr:ATP-dependent helicase [Fulvitalea axinellae]
MSIGFNQLDHRVQRWVHRQKWKNLRDIQEQAIGPILKEGSDVVISASTASGKTEAFFLPACTKIADQDEGFGILYLSPLKALINDQYRRLEGLCEMLDMNVVPWHGDISQARRNKAKKNPSGIILMTPESLEARLIKDMGWVRRAFSFLRYIVIDEFHAFVGTERGQQLTSLMNRLDALAQDRDLPIPRVALSATLGNINDTPALLRQNYNMPCEIIQGKGESELQLVVKGYYDLPGAQRLNENALQDLYAICRGGSHLVFANSRGNTEDIAARASDLCENNFVPNEFFPHHGSLSRELREFLEKRLQKEDLPTTAVCTMTLELGIDIGKVDSVIQVTPPHSVASLRQRMGRSGRRGTPSVLRMLIPEDKISHISSPGDKLRLRLLQSIAIIRLYIVEKWYEPAESSHFHFSTLVHQILALIAQWGGARAAQIFDQLCDKGSFGNVTIPDFKKILTHMGKKELIQQMHNGELVLGIEGERLVNNYNFYTVFNTPEEYRVVNNEKTIGSLPTESLVTKGQHIIFAGRRWKVNDVDEEKKTVYVNLSKGGVPPKFIGDPIPLHQKIRDEMYKIFNTGDYRIDIGGSKVDFLDSSARNLFKEGLEYFNKHDLSRNKIINENGYVYLVLWASDKIVKTLQMIFGSKGYEVSSFHGIIEIKNVDRHKIENLLKNPSILMGEWTNAKLSSIIGVRHIEKYDEYVPDDLLINSYGNRYFDVKATKHFLEQLYV